MICVKAAIKQVKATPDDNFESGCKASFVRLNGRFGIKFYSDRAEATWTYRRQKSAAKHGLAPNVGQRVNWQHRGQKYFGYITETVTETLGSFARNLGKLHDREFWDMPIYATLRQAVGSLNEDLQAAVGFGLGDDHFGNCGLMEDGRIVFIDFSEGMPYKE